MSLARRARRLEDRINALALRERVLLLIALLGIAFVIADALLLRPLEARRETIAGQLEQARGRVTALSGSVERLASRSRQNPDTELRRERDALERQIDAATAELSALDTGLLTPEQTLDVLRQVLTERPDLRLLSLAKLPAEPLDPENPDGGIYVHRFRIEFETDFSGVLGYVRLLEGLHRGLYWESLRLDVPRWPTNRAGIVLYMLTLDEDWLGV